MPAVARTAEQFTGLAVTGQSLRPVDPGVVLVSEWRDDEPSRIRPTAAEVSCYGVVARKA